MTQITFMDYMVLKYIPVFPVERSRGDIVRLIKQEEPVRCANITTGNFDAILAKYTKMFLLAEDKNIPDNVIFKELENDAECLQCTLKPIDIAWVYANIGMALEDEEDIFEDEED